MKRNTQLLLAGMALMLVFVVYSCKKDSTASVSNGGGADSTLINIGNNIILPSYRTLAASVDSMDAAITDFNTNPTADKLTALQGIFKNACIGWQSVSEYNGFGPASLTQPPMTGLNLFPTTTATIDNNIATNNNSVNAFTNATAKGFPAIDYLLFGAGSNTLANYTTDANATNRKQYLAAVSADIKTEVHTALTGWEASGGNYISTFVNGTGNSLSSSLGLLINSLDQDFEILKNDRLGIPLGKQPPGTTLPILPNEVEAYYSGISVQLALTQIKAAQGIYLGTAAQGNGRGLDAYLVKINAPYNGGLLSDTIKAHFNTAITELQAIPDPLSATIQANAAPATAVYVEIQKLVVLLKTDMPSSLGVLITYGDNDGD